MTTKKTKPFRLKPPARKIADLHEAKRIIKALDEQACKLIEIFANHGFVTDGETLPITTEILCNIEKLRKERDAALADVARIREKVAALEDDREHGAPVEAGGDRYTMRDEAAYLRRLADEIHAKGGSAMLVAELRCHANDIVREHGVPPQASESGASWDSNRDWRRENNALRKALEETQDAHRQARAEVERLRAEMEEAIDCRNSHGEKVVELRDRVRKLTEALTEARDEMALTGAVPPQDRATAEEATAVGQTATTNVFLGATRHQPKRRVDYSLPADEFYAQFPGIPAAIADLGAKLATTSVAVTGEQEENHGTLQAAT